MPRFASASLVVVAIFSCLLFTSAALARTNPEYTQVGHNIYIGADQQVGDLTCFGCSIYIRGQVAGDITAFGGSIALQDQAQVTGDVTAFAGNVRLDKTIKISGDTIVFGGELRRPAEAQIAGDVNTFGGRAWIPVIVLLPLMFMGMLVAFIVWLVQRARRPARPAYAQP